MRERTGPGFHSKKYITQFAPPFPFSPRDAVVELQHLERRRRQRHFF
jgi:hypothetical protein